jgi:hypothetical protein
MRPSDKAQLTRKRNQLCALTASFEALDEATTYLLELQRLGHRVAGQALADAWPIREKLDTERQRLGYEVGRLEREAARRNKR